LHHQALPHNLVLSFKRPALVFNLQVLELLPVVQEVLPQAVLSLPVVQEVLPAASLLQAALVLLQAVSLLQAAQVLPLQALSEQVLVVLFLLNQAHPQPLLCL